MTVEMDQRPPREMIQVSDSEGGDWVIAMQVMEGWVVEKVVRVVKACSATVRVLA